MKKVIICLLIPVIFQHCTNELHEIDSVVSAQVNGVSEGDLVIENKDIPLNSFSAFYYYLENHKTIVNNQLENTIFHQVKNDDPRTDLGAHWVGDFNFESGDYEFDIKTDKGLKVFVDDKLVFEDWANSKETHFRMNLSLQGIRRLKVFYNLNSKQKLEKIKEYYASLNRARDQSDSKIPTGKPSSISSDALTKSLLDKTLVAINWRILRGN